jgi:hypothetical protein
MEPTGSLSHFQFVVESGGGVFRGVMPGDEALDLASVVKQGRWLR